MKKRVAVFGATGAQGNPVVEEALKQNWRVRAVVRSNQNTADLKSKADVELVNASLDDQDSLAAVLQDVDAAFLHLPTPRDASEPVTWLTNFIAAAHKVKLPHLVYTTSGPAGNRYPASVIIDGANSGVDAILSSGIPSVVLKPAIYLENLLPELFLPNLRKSGVLDYPPLPASLKVQWTSHYDQAQIAVSALSKPNLAGQAFEIGTHQALTGNELAVLVAKWIERPVEFTPVSPAEFGQRVGSAIGNDLASFALTDLYQAIASLDNDAMEVDTGALESIFDVQLGSVESHLASWKQA
ncbi:hypothetical protein TW84_10620 [Vibrio neptunius]|uniref:SDR family oxidoreductase n=1 Tax=Vibrio neptunius TaxID=170651 RepID=UPI0005FA0433|nr:NmrA family NAD(P)-binding protein [Vibrio neptunius]KJY90289.1 hypothetical protein TW84_10620 [Vibrio neptunius]